MSSKADQRDTNPAFAIFRASEAVALEETDIMSNAPPGPNAVMPPVETMTKGVSGATNDLLFAGSGFSIVKIWFKSGFPLPRHSHNGGCVYYILAGSLKMGPNELGPGDGFFVGADVPYSYVAGDEGVELLEFRGSDAFDIKLLVNNADWWTKAARTIEERAPLWPDEQRPSQKTPA